MRRKVTPIILAYNFWQLYLIFYFAIALLFYSLRKGDRSFMLFIGLMLDKKEEQQWF